MKIEGEPQYSNWGSLDRCDQKRKLYFERIKELEEAMDNFEMRVKS